MEGKKIYLAIPFSNLEELSFQCANEVASLLIGQGHYVYSPISHSYPIWHTTLVPHTYDVWLRLDSEFVRWSEWVYVVNIVGHNGSRLIEESKGVQMELGWAKEQNKGIVEVFYNPITKTITDYVAASR